MRSEDILRKKTIHWKHEAEYRIICDEEYVSVKDQITGVYLGLHNSEVMRKAIVNNAPENVPVFTTRLDKRNVEVVVGSQIN